MSDFLNQNSKVTMGVAIGVILLCLYLLISRFTADPEYTPPTDKTVPLVWYYDRNTRQLFTMPAHEYGLVERESGPYNGEPAGVRAYVFACGDCSTNEQFIGYLERPSAKEALANDMKILETELMPLVCEVGRDNWVELNSREGERIRAAIDARCPDGGKANYCVPTEEKK